MTKPLVSGVLATGIAGLLVWGAASSDPDSSTATNAYQPAAAAQSATTQRPTTTTSQPRSTTTADMSPVVSIECPPLDQGDWDYYDANFSPDLELSSNFGSAHIDYGDGKSYDSATIDDANQNMFWHRYKAPGRYRVTLSISDDAGRVGKASCTFNWKDAPQATTIAPPVYNIAPLVSSCDPNYDGGCVPIDSDVDCAGGSGNGPSYVRGPVRVVGSDIYGLDGNNNGIGCE